MKIQQLIFTILVFCTITLTACGGGGSSSPTVATVSQGVLIDSAVEGVYFETKSQSGFTNSSGAFNYQTGEIVNFFIGDILLGSTTGATMVTPIDFVAGASDETNPQVINILRFVQSLDSDSNPANGIHITAATSVALTGQTLDFSLAEASFETAFNSISGAVLGGLSLVSVADAQAHFVSSVDFLDGTPTTPGDLDGDGDVDVNDFSMFQMTFGRCTGDSAFNADADYDQDGCVTFVDYQTWYGFFINP